MDRKAILTKIEKDLNITFTQTTFQHSDELYVKVKKEEFNRVCLALHKELKSPVMSFFAVDETKENNLFKLYCVFKNISSRTWFFLCMDIDSNSHEYNSLSKEIFSAALFEREMKEMFGLDPVGSPDKRSLRLHEEVWPKDNFPLRKDFDINKIKESAKGLYAFNKTEGDGMFEVLVGPVHAGIIGPGHFRFSMAGEPIVNLELRLGFTHRGVEKLFEGKNPDKCVKLAERVSGDSSFAHSLAFCHSVEKMRSISVPTRAQTLRCIFLELERLYNHANDIGGIALDVGFSFPSAFASVIKESILALNDTLTGSRYLKEVNVIGGVSKDIDNKNSTALLTGFQNISEDFKELKDMLLSDGSFMDRVDSTGILEKKTAEDIGMVGMAARASGIKQDLRKDFPGGLYAELDFKEAKQTKGDVLSRLNIRLAEFEESIKIITQCIGMLKPGELRGKIENPAKAGNALGYCEGWRGPVLYWLKIDSSGSIERCKVTDPSFHNWPGLSYSTPGNITPDFPLCNKSFDLSYPGNDL